MITEPLFYVLGVEERAYLCHSRRFWIRPFTKGNPGGYTPQSIGLFTRRQAMAILRSLPKAWGQPDGSIEIRLAPRCQICGKDEFRAKIVDPTEGPWRCYDHRDRNPCAIEGCSRSTPAPENTELPDPLGRLRSDQWICAPHWRRYCPPRSARRRVYNRFLRLARRDGWSPELYAQFWRFWGQVVRTARRKADAGTIDKAGIAKLFGWEAI